MFLVAVSSLLTLPVVVGIIVARDALADHEVRLTQVAATIVALGMMAHLSGLLVSQAVVSVVWPDIRLQLGPGAST